MSTSNTSVSGKQFALFFAAVVFACMAFIAITKHAEKTARAVSASAIAEGRSK